MSIRSGQGGRGFFRIAGVTTAIFTPSTIRLTPLAPAPKNLADLLPFEASTRQRALVRDLVLISAAVILTAVAAQIRIVLPGLPVPVTGQTFGVLLGAAALGPWRGAIAQVAYVLLGIAGLPIFTGGYSGWTALAGATGGYLVGFVLASLAVGYVARQGADRRILSAAGAFGLGTVIIYAVGVPWLAVTTGMSARDALWFGAVVFLAGDVVKAVLASTVLPAAWKLAR
jgi:biotin transport system substrate-specific component